MNPLPALTIGTLPADELWGFLEYDHPIEDPSMLAFQVAQLTLGMRELKRQLGELSEGNIE
jgi:hypothetical protein